VLLQTVLLATHSEKETMSPKGLDCKHFHAPHTISSGIVPEYQFFEEWELTIQRR
jgi:hypothetical protein